MIIEGVLDINPCLPSVINFRRGKSGFEGKMKRDAEQRRRSGLDCTIPSLERRVMDRRLEGQTDGETTKKGGRPQEKAAPSLTRRGKRGVVGSER